MENIKAILNKRIFGRINAGIIAYCITAVAVCCCGCSGNEQPREMAHVSAHEAENRAAGLMGLDREDVESFKTSLDKKNDLDYYSVIITNEGEEYNFSIDALTGAVIETDYEAYYGKPDMGIMIDNDGNVVERENIQGQVSDYKSQNISGLFGGAFDVDGCISVDEALSLAFERVPGSSISDLVSFEIDYDDGVFEYEGVFRYDGMEYEFEIDAYSGIFREWKADYS